MAVIIRIDVDGPFGKKNIVRHLLSRVASDLYFPRVRQLGYLQDLEEILLLLNNRGITSFVFFRRCSLPSPSVMGLMKAGHHIFGLHLENSRSMGHFKAELRNLERHIAADVIAVSKHGSGVNRYGLFHYAPYEPEKYQIWAHELGMKVFFGNLEDPTQDHYIFDADLQVYPAAFWLEPQWRDVSRFSVEWLLEESASRDIILLLHPENVTADHKIMADLLYLMENCTFTLSGLG